MLRDYRVGEANGQDGKPKPTRKDASFVQETTMTGGSLATKDPARLRREKKTLEAMIRIFCRRNHAQRGGLCPSCGDLLDYAVARLDHCPFGQSKPVCAQCPVHCYKPAMRDQIRRVMRSAGPWMLVNHPFLTIRHYLDNWLAGTPQTNENGGSYRLRAR